MIRQRFIPNCFHGSWCGHASLLATGLAAAFVSFQAHAQVSEYRHERASIAVGVFLTDRQTQTQLDSDSGSGTDIDMEDDLGLKASTNVFRFGADVWFKPRQRFDFSIFDLSRSATRDIDQTIIFGDQTYVVDTTVTTDSDLTIAKADYTYAVLDRRQGYLGVTGGLYVMAMKLTLSEASLGTAESEDLTAPLPVIGLRGEYAFNDRVTLRGASQWFSIDVDDTSGSLRDIYIGADYRFGGRFAMGLAYNDVETNVRAEDSGGWQGRLDWSYDGWLIYFKTDFGRD